MKNIHIILFTVFSVAILFTSCKKEYSDPTIKVVPTGSIKTIAEIRAMYEPGQTVKITTDISVYGVVTMDETTGNLYKESFITDATGNLYVRFISGSGLFTGDSILVNLNGAKILKYNQMLQIDSLHPDNNIVKLATQVFQTPEVVSISSLYDGSGDPLESAQAKLIQLNNVFFVDGGVATFADGANLTAGSRFLEDGNGVQIEVRTSGYANFADDTLPNGVGSFIGIVAQYNSGLQLVVRDPNELDLSNPIPTLLLFKDFNDQSLTSGGWTSQSISGPSSTNWDIYAATNSAAKVSNYDPASSGAVVSESWLISPSLDLSVSTTPSFTFQNVVRYSLTPEIQVLVSTDYDGVSNPNTATWTDLTSSASLDTDDSSWSSWTNSGSISLAPYNQAGTYIAFKLTGVTSSSSTWEIDDIKIYN